MKRFQFSLEALRLLRERQEQDALEHYAGAVRRFQSAASELEAVHRELEAAFRWLEDRRRAAIPALELTQIEAYSRAIAERRRACEQTLESRRSEMAVEWTRLIEARRHREAIEKLRDKQFAAHQATLRAAEQSLLDELGARPGKRPLHGLPPIESL